MIEHSQLTTRECSNRIQVDAEEEKSPSSAFGDLEHLNLKDPQILLEFQAAMGNAHVDWPEQTAQTNTPPSLFKASTEQEESTRVEDWLPHVLLLS